MKPRASKSQDDCIIGDHEMDMVLGRALHDKYGKAEPSDLVWRQLRNRAMAARTAATVPPPVVHRAKRGTINGMLPRIAPTLLAVVMLAATALTNGADLAGFALQGANQPAAVDNSRVDSHAAPNAPLDLMVKNDPNINRQLALVVEQREQPNGISPDEARFIHTQETHPTVLNVSNAPIRTKSGDYELR